MSKKRGQVPLHVCRSEIPWVISAIKASYSTVKHFHVSNHSAIMGKLSHETKAQILQLHRTGLKPTGITKSLAVSRRQATYWIEQFQLGYFDPEQTVENNGHNFRSTSIRDLEVVRKSLALNGQQSCTDLHKELRKDGAQHSISTTRRIIAAAGYTSATPRYTQLVRDANKEKRVKFCEELIAQDDLLEDIIFTDESSIQLHHNKKTTYRLKGSLNPNLPKPKHPLKVHVWGGISRRGQTKIVVFEQKG